MLLILCCMCLSLKEGPRFEFGVLLEDYSKQTLDRVPHLAKAKEPLSFCQLAVRIRHASSEAGPA